MTRWFRRRRTLDADLEREIQGHLDRHAADLVARGHHPDEARRLARIALGGAVQVTEATREVHRWRWLHDARQDARYALRLLRQRPGFAAAVVGTLALGIGATAVMFTIVNSVLLAPLAFPNPNQLLTVRERTDWSTAWGNMWAASYPNYLDCRRVATTAAIGAWRYNGGTISGSGDPEYVDGYETSASLWSVIGTPLAAGRVFTDADDQPAAAPVAIISYDLWRRRFAASPSAIGATLVFEGTTRTVVGVTAAGFRLSDDADIFVPLGQSADQRLKNREMHPGLNVWARLHPGVSSERAQAELAVIARGLEAQFPASNKGRTFVAEPLRPDVGTVGPTLWLLFGAVGLVLLLACANVASLLLSRALARRRELAMRAALGAGRGRLIRQCLTESAVLGAIAGAVGLGIAIAGVRPFVALWPGALPRAAEVFVDWRALAFTTAISLGCSVLFGLAPALATVARASDLAHPSGTRGVQGDSRRWHGLFVLVEVAVAVILLVCAGTLGRTLLRTSRLDPGLDIHNVLVARFALTPSILADAGATRAAWDDVMSRTRRLPGVSAVAIVDTVPMRNGNNELPYSTTAALAPSPADRPIALATSVSNDYVAVMGLRLISGRFFDARDRAGSQLAIVIDDVLARRAFGTAQAAGNHLWVPDIGPGPIEVVGVVEHVRHWGLASDDRAGVRAQLYYPFAQLPDRLVRRWSQLMSIAVRTMTPPATVVEPMRHELRGQANDQALYDIRTLEELASASLSRERFLSWLFGLFAAVSLVLACGGIYGVLSFLTSRRVPEIAVRVALGALPRQVVALVLGQSLAPIVGGAIVGTLAAIGIGRILVSALDSVHGLDPAAFALTIAALGVAAVLATMLPVRRAIRVDPAIALRMD